MNMNDYCELHLLKQELKFLMQCKDDFLCNGNLIDREYNILSTGYDIEKRIVTPFGVRIAQKYRNLLKDNDKFLDNIEENILLLKNFIEKF